MNRSAAVNAQLAFVISSIFVAFQVHLSSRSGTLSLPATYDDVRYFVDAAIRIGEFRIGGVTEVLRGYISNPPHAPGSTLLAILGFLIFGMASVSAAISTVIPLFFVVLSLLYLCNKLPMGVAVTTVSSLLLIPIFGLAIVEFRPDMWCAIYTVVGTLLIALGDTHQNKGRAIYAGLAFSAALLMKPTFSPMVVIMFGAAFALQYGPLLYQKKNSLQMMASAGLIIGIPFILAGPHYLLALPQLIDYYNIHVFGTVNAVWKPDLTWWSRLLYYVTGDGGRPAIGPWIFLCAMVIAIALWLWRRRRWSELWSAVSLIILTLLAYAIVTVPGMKSPYLGMVFPAFLAAGVVLSVVFVLNELYRRGAKLTAVLFCSILLAFAIGTYQSPWMALHSNPLPTGFATARFEVLDRVADAFARQPGLGNEKILFTQIGQYLNPATLTFRLQQENRPVPEFLENYLSDDADSFELLFQQATYVVAMTPDNSEIMGWLPSTIIAATLFDRIVPSGFELIEQIPESGGTGQVHIYHRVTPEVIP